MATLKAVIVPAKVLKDGKHKIRISIAHNGETRYIVTDITINSEKEFKNGAIVKRPDAAILNTKLRGLLQRYQSVIDELEYINGLTCPELVYQIKNAHNDRHRTLLSIYEEYMENANIKQSTYKEYAQIWKGLTCFLNKSMLIENINHGTVLSLDKYLRDRGLKSGRIRNYVAFLLILLSYAKRCGYVQYRVDPFAGYELPQAEVRQSWLSVDEIKKIRDFQIEKKPLKKCRDIFMLSYYLGGINITDLIDINFNEQHSTIHYIRKKTENRPKINKFVEFDIPEEAKEIIIRNKTADGYLNITPFQRETNLHLFFKVQIKKLADATGIKKLVYYSARKSFSQHAFLLGINTSVIDYILGHKVDRGGASLYSYITVTPDMATKAVRKVLDNLK